MKRDPVGLRETKNYFLWPNNCIQVCRICHLLWRQHIFGLVQVRVSSTSCGSNQTWFKSFVNASTWTLDYLTLTEVVESGPIIIRCSVYPNNAYILKFQDIVCLLPDMHKPMTSSKSTQTAKKRLNLDLQFFVEQKIFHILFLVTSLVLCC